MNKNKKNEDITIGITQGDINGIGYEVIIKTLSDTKLTENRTIIVYGSPKVASYYKKILNIPSVNFNQIRNAREAVKKKINIINVNSNEIRVEVGKSTSLSGEVAFQALEAATNDMKENLIDVLITAPINKKNINSPGFNFPGHTEYLNKVFNVEESLMFLVSDRIKVGVVTGHVPITRVPSYITEANICKKIRLMNQSLIQDFAIRKPKIAVLGLNPHAGDEGIIGNEESKIITPAINKMREEGVLVLGPYSADGFFGSGDFQKFDAILAMYHDQGLVPFKTIAFEEGVNFTAGLPIVRTSPGHGTAYDIAGENKASEISFRNAFFLAEEIYKNRNELKNLLDNQLKTQDLEK